MLPILRLFLLNVLSNWHFRVCIRFAEELRDCRIELKLIGVSIYTNVPAHSYFCIHYLLSDNVVCVYYQFAQLLVRVLKKNIAYANTSTNKPRIRNTGSDVWISVWLHFSGNDICMNGNFRFECSNTRMAVIM